MIDELRPEIHSSTLTDFTAHIADRLGIEVLPWETFELAPEDFLDINHMNARGGREKLSRQLAGMLNL